MVKLRNSSLWNFARSIKQYIHSFVPSQNELLLREHKKLLCMAVKYKDSSFFVQGQMDINPLSYWHNNAFVKETGGYLPGFGDTEREVLHLEPYDIVRRDMLILLLRTVISKDIGGDIAELGVYKGDTAKLFHYYAPEKQLHLFDTFEGFPEEDINNESNLIKDSAVVDLFKDTSVNSVRDHILPLNENVNFYKGYFPNSIPNHLDKSTFCFIHLDADLYKPIIEGLNFFYPRVNKGGIIVCHDYNAWPGARKAMDEFFAQRSETPVPMPDKSGSAIIIKN